MNLSFSIKSLIVPCLVCATTVMQAQNLVPNYSFEIISTCPTGQIGICYGFASPWECGNQGSSDLFNVCSNPSEVGVPDNGRGSQDAHTGFGYAGILCRYEVPNYREYLLVPLTAPLDTGTWYTITFYLSLGDNYCGIQHIGAYFSASYPYVNNGDFIPVTPQLETDMGFLSDDEGWTWITGCFQAVGGEKYLMIGNFNSDSDSPLDPNCHNEDSYYYIDDVSVVEGMPPEEIILNPETPVTACFSYEIDPMHPGPYFMWNTGAHSPTLSVAESGTYTVTVSDGCSTGTAEVEVTIEGNHEPVELGPDSIIICEGNSYEVELDPSLSEYTWNDGSNASDYFILEPGLYSVTLDDGCSITTDQITAILLAPPEPFSLGADQNICSWDQLEFSFDPSLGDFNWQDNSTSANYTITSSGNYALTISNSCGEESDDIEVTTLDIPEVEIGPNIQQICEGDVIDIDVDPALGDLLWQDGSTASYYEISTSGTYTLMISNECGTGSDEMNVSIVEPPVFDLGSDTTLCTGDTIVLDAPGVLGNYVWQDNSQNESIMVTTPGVFVLSVSNLCGDAVDSINVYFNTVVIPPDLGPDLTLCSVQQIVLYANSPNANCVWQDTSTADSLLVTSSGTYTVQVSNTCSSASDTVLINFNGNPPQVDLPTQLSLCQGQSVTIDAVVSGVTYLWNDNSQNQQLIVNTPGTYSVTVANACGTAMDSTLILDGGPAPYVALGNDVQLCAGDAIMINPDFMNVDTWVWQDGSTMPSFVVTGPGVVTVEASNTCGTSFDTLLATVLSPVPPLDLGVDTALCSSETLILSINTPGVNILWPDGSTGSDYAVSVIGPVYASITNSCGTSLDTLMVSGLPDIPNLNLGNDQSLCPGETITINPSISNVNYVWQDGSTNNYYQTTHEETIILTITNSCGTSTDTVEVIENTLGPHVDLGPDIQACQGEIVTIPAGISGVNYVWQDGSTNAEFATSQSGEFILNVNNLCGTDTDTIMVDISGLPPVVALGVDTTVCEGTSITLVSSVDPANDIEWQDGSTASTFVVNSPGIYSLSATNHCGNAEDSIFVSYLDAPDPFVLHSDTLLCPGESVTLTAPTTLFDVQWQDGSSQPVFVADHAGTYTLQLSNECGSVADDFTLTYDTRILQLNLDPQLKWCAGDVITLDATQPFAADYHWNTGVTTSTLQINSTGLYTIDISTLCNNLSQSVDIIPDNDCDTLVNHTEIHIPNVFSPNGDNINDIFGISFGSDIGLVNMHGTIFDRWGNMMFDSDDIPFRWDGYHNRERVMPGVYVYRIVCEYNASGQVRQKIFVGDITVIR